MPNSIGIQLELDRSSKDMTSPGPIRHIDTPIKFTSMETYHSTSPSRPTQIPNPSPLDKVRDRPEGLERLVAEAPRQSMVPKSAFKNHTQYQLDDQSTRLSDDQLAILPKPTSYEGTALPGGTTAFEHAIRPFLLQYEGQQTFPSFRFATDPSETSIPPQSFDLSQGAKTSSDRSEEVKIKEAKEPEEDTPPHLRRHNDFQTRLRLVQLRTLLLRCTVLQSTVWELERKDWAQMGEHTPQWHYVQIRQLACQARVYAEALQSSDLQARCEYWSGRGCGGIGDYSAAAEHFSLAMKLDIPNDTDFNGKVRLRGLAPREKEDVHFLYRSVVDRRIRLEKKIAKARALARSNSYRANGSTEGAAEKGVIEDPLWLPDRDRIVAIAKSKFSEKREFSDSEGLIRQPQSPPRPGNSSEERAEKWLLSRTEWQYIRNEDNDGAARRRIPLATDPRPKLQSQYSYSSSQSINFNHPRPLNRPQSSYYGPQAASSSTLPNLELELGIQRRANHDKYRAASLSPFEDQARNSSPSII